MMLLRSIGRLDPAAGSIRETSGPPTGRRHATARSPVPDKQSDQPVGEFALIDAIIERLGGATEAIVGPGDDAAVVAAPDGRVVASTDVLVDGVHFRRSWSSAQDIGVRATAANLADVVAMGARPTALLVGLALPTHIDRAFVLALADGLREEAARAGAAVVGGDVVASDQLVVSVTALGDLGGRAPVLRSGARPGDTLALAGRAGWAAGGLAVLSRGFKAPRVLVDAHRRPEPDYAAALLAAGVAHAMCDVSDGLVADAGHLARASGVAVDLDPAAIGALVTAPMRDVAAALGGADPAEWVLGGGDDHAFLAAFDPAAPLPQGWVAIGAVEEGSAGAVTVGGAAPPVQGHEHRVG
jgi:thiamine-monophosphate kinase